VKIDDDGGYYVLFLLLLLRAAFDENISEWMKKVVERS
jgi:hypothetical protein